MIYKATIFLIVTIALSIDALKVIHTPQGAIRGIHKKSYNGRTFEAYNGIPYAKPPVGNLRFSDPEPYGSWEGVRNAKKESHVCVQQKYLSTQIIGSEDCLYANVYTPSTAHHKRYPVLVWIHGGGFDSGTGNTLFYLPDYLLDKDIVLVTFNYRLGVLGFASTEDEVLPGNYGLKDQVLALKWVKHHIASYGGNPDKVTIFGQSAGASSVHLLMMSPLSKGLFHRAIPMSGAATAPWAITAKGVVAHHTRKLASVLGCPKTDSTSVINCLRDVQSTDLFITHLPSLLEWDIDPALFLPVVESENVTGAFLTKSPFHVKTKVPMLVGMTSGEGAFRTAGFHRTGGISKKLAEINKKFNKIVPITLGFDLTAKHPAAVAKHIRKFYFGNKKIDDHLRSNVTRMYTDSWFTQAVTELVRKNSAPSYLYLFDYRGSHSVTDLLSDSTENFGVCHADDLIYILPLVTYIPNCRHLNHKDKIMREKMLTLWTNFVIHGNPTPKGHLKWKPTNGKNLDYLHIKFNSYKMEKRLLSHRDHFWQHLPTRDYSHS